ncbi:MAG: N-acetylneuraminate lyase [Lachnospiraceae bacterium]
MIEMKGIYPALVTPFTDTNKVDEKALQNLVEQLLKTGIDGFYVGGSTGESLLMSYAERRRVLEIVKSQTGTRAKIVAHIGSFHTDAAIKLAEHARDTGVDAISSLPPFYYKFTMNELQNYYHRIADAVDLPLIVYNAPALTGIAFDSDNIAPIFEHPRMAGIKFTSYDLFQMQRMMQKYDKLIINGHDEIFLSSLAIGCPMAIGSTFNFMPEVFIKIRMYFQQGEIGRAQKLQSDANEVIELLSKIGVFRGVKGMMNIKGLPSGTCREPFLPLTPEEMRELEAAFTKLMY